MASSEILEGSGVVDDASALPGDGSIQSSSSFKSENLGEELLNDLDSYLKTGVVDDASALTGDGSIQSSSSFKSENIGEELLDDLDSYLKDIDDRLAILRMVSNSVIKGMVNAVTEEAAEKIALKEMEMASLKERLPFYGTGVDGVEKLQDLSLSNTVVEEGSMEECLGNLRIAAEKQFQMLEKEIENIKGFGPIWGLNSGSELLELSEGNESKKWIGLDRTLNTMKNILGTFYERVDDMVCLSKTSFYEWQQEREFQDKLESMVIQNFVRSLQEEFELALWEQSLINQSQMKNKNELSSLRQELDAISRYLSNPDTGQLPPHGSQGELQNTTLEIMDSAQLKHMSKDDLIKYFKTEMTKMKRNHESHVLGITEECFTLKREFLKERGPSKKDKEFEAFRKKISEVILKLDDILMENVKLPLVYGNAENLTRLKYRNDTLLSENRHLKDLLTDKIKEVKCLSSQVSDAEGKMSNHSLTESNLSKQLRKVKCDIEDMTVEVSVREDIYKSIFKEFIGKIKWDIEDFKRESIAMLEICEVIFREAVKDGKTTIKWDIEDSDLEFMIMQEMCGVTFREAVKDAECKINLVLMKYEEENERRACLEASLLEREKTLSLEIEEKEKLNEENILLSALMEEKEKLALEVSSKLMKEMEQFDQISKEFSRLRDQTIHQERLISENVRESNLLKNSLDEALGKIWKYEDEICKLNQTIQFAMKGLKNANEEIRMLHETIQDKEKTIALIKANEMEHKKQIESTIVSIKGLYKAAADFERWAVETVEKNNLRLEKLKFQCTPLVGEATLFRRTELVYKQRLERRYSDLQKAEAEVDLLGDEVDALLSLLEKIYIALDHYSPILQHYPGVMEILKLVRRELSAETAKPV